jgi:hypothetical protein
MYRRDPQSLGGPSDIETYDVAFADQIDSRHRAADARARDRHERKLKRDLLAAMRSHYAAAARAVELENHPLIEISRKALAVEIVLVGHYLGSYGIDMQVCNSPSALSMYPIALALCP